MAITLLTGASSGLGAALAPLLAADGDRLALAARRAEDLETLAERIRAGGGEALALPLDVTDRAAVRDAVARVEATWGPVETLIANAGIGITMTADTFDAATVERQFAVNVQGMMHCIEAVLPAMLAAGRGHIVGVGSLAGYRGFAGSAAYCGTKAAVRVLLEGLRVELRGRGIAVTHIAPGFVDTPMTQRNAFEMPFLMPVEAGARQMRRAIRAKKAHHAFPWQMRWLVGLGRLMPPWLWDRVVAGQVAQKAPER